MARAATFTPTGGNDTSAVQAIIDGFGPQGGDLTILPGSGCGLYAVDLSNADGVHIHGGGAYNTQLVALGADSAVFKTELPHDVVGHQFDNFTITNAVPRTGGAYFDFKGRVRRAVFEDLHLEGWFNAVSMPSFEENHLNRLKIVKPSGAGTAIILGAPNVANSANLTISNCFIRGFDDINQVNLIGGFGILAYDIDALFMQNTDIGAFVQCNMFINASVRANNFYFTQCFFDVTQQNHSVLVAGAGTKSQWGITNCWFASAGIYPGGAQPGKREACGLAIFGGAMGTVQISNSRFYNNSGSGLYCAVPNSLQLSGNSFESNGSYGVNQRYGFMFVPPTPSGAPMLVGNDFLNNSPGPYFFGPNATGVFMPTGSNRV